MALNFPTNPVDGQLFDRYVYDDTKGVWNIVPDDVFPYYVGPTKPANPKDGTAWFNSENGTTYMYYDDGVGSSGTNRTNLLTNPSFELDAAGWYSPLYASYSTSSIFSYSGTKSLEVSPIPGTDGIGTYASTTNGQEYTFSAYVYTPTTQSFFVGTPSGDSPTAVVSANTWTRLNWSFIANSTTSDVYILAGSGSLGEVFYVDAALLEHSSTLGSYFDGSTSGATWSGTAHASTSTLVIPAGSSGQWVATSGMVVSPSLSEISNFNDVTFTLLSEGDVMTYDSDTSQWVNSNPNNQIVKLNPQTVSENLTIPSGYNGTTAGPITITDGVIVTIANGSAWSIV